MHYEHQPHDYAAAFTTSRNADRNGRGHFYLGSYGIKVEASANSVVVWRPKDVHGTSLQNRDPYKRNPSFNQTGLAIVTSARLPKVWEKYIANLDLNSEASKKMAKIAADEIYSPKNDADEIYDVLLEE